MMERENYLGHMESNVFKPVGYFCKCVWNKSSEKGRRPLQFFTAYDTTKFLAMDITEPLKKMLHGNLFVLVMTDCFSTLTRVVLTSKTISVYTAPMFMNR